MRYEIGGSLLSLKTGVETVPVVDAVHRDAGHLITIESELGLSSDTTRIGRIQVARAASAIHFTGEFQRSATSGGELNTALAVVHLDTDAPEPVVVRTGVQGSEIRSFLNDHARRESAGDSGRPDRKLGVAREQQKNRRQRAA